jgi:hypothetical protein
MFPPWDGSGSIYAGNDDGGSPWPWPLLELELDEEGGA